MRQSSTLAAGTLLGLFLTPSSDPVPALAAAAEQAPAAGACDCLALGLQGDQLAFCRQQMPGGCGREEGCYEAWQDPGHALTIHVKFHIVYAQGALQPGGVPCTSPPDQAELSAMLDLLNASTSPANMHFVQLGEIHRFESGTLHRIGCEQELATLLQQANEPNAVDVYWVDQLNPIPSAAFCPGTEICASLNGWGSFTTTSLGQGVVLRNCADEVYNPCDCPAPPPFASCGACPADCGIYREKVFIHELGHYFDLLHPHETIFGVECTDAGVDDCSTCGDSVCDTRAEPAPSTYEVGPGCTVVGAPPPACGGAPYQIDLTNYMSQKQEGLPCRDRFTRHQLRRMRATLLNLRAEELL